MSTIVLNRRSVLAGTGALIVSFSLRDAFAQDQGTPAAAPPPPPGSLKGAPYLDSWIRIDADGGITVFTGKAEIGQGFKTACQQIAALLDYLRARFSSQPRWTNTADIVRDSRRTQTVLNAPADATKRDKP